MQAIEMHITPDFRRENGFGREYVEAQLRGNEPGEDLGELRETLAELDGFFDDQLERTIQVSPWLKAKLAEVACGGIITTLTRKQAEGDGYVVPDLLFENVLQAHHYALAELTREARPQFEAFVADFTVRTRQLVDAGILPPNVLPLLTALSDIKFAVNEGYIEPDTLAECQREPSDAPIDIIVSPQAVEKVALFESTVFHELVHAIAGSETSDHLINYLKSILPDARNAHDLYRPIEEALTEHIAQVILGRREIDDASIEKNPEAYEMSRRFLTAIGDKIPIHELVYIYFGNTPDQENSTRLKQTFSEGDPNIADYFQLMNHESIDKVFTGVASSTDLTLN